LGEWFGEEWTNLKEEKKTAHFGREVGYVCPKEKKKACLEGPNEGKERSSDGTYGREVKKPSEKNGFLRGEESTRDRNKGQR